MYVHHLHRFALLSLMLVGLSKQVAPALQSVVEGIVDDYVTQYPSLVKKHGKKVFELRPQVRSHVHTALDC